MKIDYYRLTAKKKKEIAQNLIDIFERDIEPSKETKIFIGNWILTSRREKFKAYYDVWEIVLNNFIPKSKPLLIRSIPRKSKLEYIASFTNSAYSALRFSEGKGYWIICDTKDSAQSIHNQKGKYRNSFYPLSEVLKKAKNSGGWGFSKGLLDHHACEDEYIMKIDFSIMHILKYVENTKSQ